MIESPGFAATLESIIRGEQEDKERRGYGIYSTYKITCKNGSYATGSLHCLETEKLLGKEPKLVIVIDVLELNGLFEYGHPYEKDQWKWVISVEDIETLEVNTAYGLEPAWHYFVKRDGFIQQQVRQ